MVLADTMAREKCGECRRISVKRGGNAWDKGGRGKRRAVVAYRQALMMDVRGRSVQEGGVEIENT